MLSTLLNLLSYLIIREIFKHLEADVLISFSMRKQVSKANNLPPSSDGAELKLRSNFTAYICSLYLAVSGHPLFQKAPSTWSPQRQTHL